MDGAAVKARTLPFHRTVLGESMNTPQPTRKFVCATCGLPLLEWHSTKSAQGWVWKHASGGRSRPSCGKLPVPVVKPANVKIVLPIEWHRFTAAVQMHGMCRYCSNRATMMQRTPGKFWVQVCERHIEK